VSIPNFTVREIDDGDESSKKIGLYGGALTIGKTKDKFKEFLKAVVHIASLQTAFLTLDQVIKITSRRVNALEYVIIPRYQGVIKYIS
jgi:V-type H+-transporting ATPase subunit D